jgi:hypothetical protein
VEIPTDARRAISKETTTEKEETEDTMITVVKTKKVVSLRGESATKWRKNYPKLLRRTLRTRELKRKTRKLSVFGSTRSPLTITRERRLSYVGSSSATVSAKMSLASCRMTHSSQTRRNNLWSCRLSSVKLSRSTRTQVSTPSCARRLFASSFL